MNTYSTTETQKLIDRYHELENSQILQTEEGCLGVGNWICKAPKMKTAIITEVYLNSWSSGHKVKMYNKTPKKYQEILDNN